MTEQTPQLSERQPSDAQLRSSIRMLNQIAANQRHFEDEDQAAAAVAAHLKKFWARSMKQQIIGFVAEGGGAELSAVALNAIEKLQGINDGR